MDILKLLEKHQWAEDHLACLECGAIKFQGDNNDPNEHEPNCSWKAAIDALRSGRVVVVDKQNEHSKYMITSKYLDRPLIFENKEKAHAWYEPRKESCEIYEIKFKKEQGK